MTKHVLSKSTFMSGCQCPLKLYLHKFKPELRNPEDESQQAIFASGTSVGLLAQGLFPGGIDVTPPDPYSYHISVAKTQELIKQGVKIIYEAAFNYDGILCAVDILVNEKGKWYAYEVKGTLEPKEPHKMDASLQYYVLTNSGLPLKDFFIVNLNREYIKRGELEVKKLFKSTSVLEDVLQNQKFIANKAIELKEMLRLKKEPIVKIGTQCDKPYPCDFTEHCWKNHVEDEIDYGKLAINKKAINEFLGEFEYPLYFFDFETVMHAVPVYDQSHPYQQVPFQFSLHIQSKKDAELEHVAFLGDGENDPREELIKELLKHLKNKGSILVWYEPFEATRLKELARDFPKYAKELNKLHDRIIDLIIPFRSKNYKHPGFEGSASLKNVLPILVPELDYGSLEIQDGGMATTTYAALKEQTTKVQKQQREALLEYCHLDTLAMVRILDKLKNV